MNSKEINNIIKLIKENLNNIKIFKSKIIDYNLGNQTKSRQFDIVVRNEFNEIVFVCDFYEGNFNNFINDIPEDINIENDFPYYYFLIFSNELKFLDINNLFKTVDFPIFSFEIFINIIKCNYPFLKKEIDFVIDDLNVKVRELNDLNSVSEQIIKKLHKDLEFEKSLFSVTNEKFLKLEINFKNLKKDVENDLKYRLELKLKETDFLERVNQIPIPEKVNEYIDKRFGVGEQNKVREIFCTYNSCFKDRFSILNNELYLKRDIYDYFSKGRIDMPEQVLSKTNYYILDLNTYTFSEVEVRVEDFLGWINF